MLRTPRLLALCITGVAVWAGCTIENVDNGSSTSATSSGDTATSTTTSSTSTGEGGSSSTSSTTAGNGGAGGGETCAGETGTGETVASCDMMNITPASAGGTASSNCNPNGGTDGTDDPWGYGACIKGFEIYTAGSAEVFQSCLAGISVSPAEACDIQNVIDCVDEVYAKACDSQKANDACDSFAEVCGADPFNAAGCKDDLRPFGDEGLQQWADCINANTVDPCQDVYDACFVQVQSD